jgi:hypothetical protein
VGGVLLRGGGRSCGFETGWGRERRWGGLRRGVEIRVGIGATMLLWSGLWLDGVPFCVRFSRLFDLFLHQACTVAHMCVLGWGGVGVAPSVVGVGGRGVGGV